MRIPAGVLRTLLQSMGPASGRVTLDQIIAAKAWLGSIPSRQIIADGRPAIPEPRSKGRTSHARWVMSFSRIVRVTHTPTDSRATLDCGHEIRNITPEKLAAVTLACSKCPRVISDGERLPCYCADDIEAHPNGHKCKAPGCGCSGYRAKKGKS